MRPAVFLDRDGVLNEAIIRDGRPYPPRSLDELRVPDGAARACAALREGGLRLVCVTNQPDIARGTQSRERVDEMNLFLVKQLGLDAVFVCEHDDDDDCACRKPRPGLLTQAALKLGLDLQHSVIVGDRWRDIAAGKSAGCWTVFVDGGYETAPVAADLIVASLSAAVPWILRRAAARG